MLDSIAPSAAHSTSIYIILCHKLGLFLVKVSLLSSIKATAKGSLDPVVSWPNAHHETFVIVIPESLLAKSNLLYVDIGLAGIYLHSLVSAGHRCKQMITGLMWLIITSVSVLVPISMGHRSQI